MQLIVIDVGNTSTAVGLWSDGRVRSVLHCDEGFPAATKALSRADYTGADAVAYVSVVPQADAAWRRWAAARGMPFHAVSHRDFVRVRGATHEIVLDYPKPETIGADRLADAAGAVSRYGAPVLVMDFGTALTAAVVTRDGVWRGGVIAPGFPLMRDYLFERTAKLPRLELKSSRVPKIGRSTEEAMRFGALIGYRGMVREIVSELAHNFKEDFRLVATGGFAKWVLSRCDLPFTIDPTLTLYGTGLVGARQLQQKSKGANLK